MGKRTVVTFRCTREMDRLITKLMQERNLDRTSVMKLALYMLSSHMSRWDVRKQSLRQVLADMEAHAPRRFPSFATFAVEPHQIARQLMDE